MATHRAWNLFRDPRMDRLERRGVFLSHDFGLPRIWLSSAVQSGGLGSLHLSSGISYSSTWALGLVSDRPVSPDPLAPQSSSSSSSWTSSSSTCVKYSYWASEIVPCKLVVVCLIFSIPTSARGSNYMYNSIPLTLGILSNLSNMIFTCLSASIAIYL